ncbi:hypothetical protein C8R43DRAFT_959242 [Mycena crocata]|nr:hypothetical protein C8R43DRAFT_959242 [Mycena crocata]
MAHGRYTQAFLAGMSPEIILSPNRFMQPFLDMPLIPTRSLGKLKPLDDCKPGYRLQKIVNPGEAERWFARFIFGGGKCLVHASYQISSVVLKSSFHGCTVVLGKDHPAGLNLNSLCPFLFSIQQKCFTQSLNRHLKMFVIIPPALRSGLKSGPGKSPVYPGVQWVLPHAGGIYSTENLERAKENMTCLRRYCQAQEGFDDNDVETSVKGWDIFPRLKCNEKMQQFSTTGFLRGLKHKRLVHSQVTRFTSIPPAFSMSEVWVKLQER